MLKITAIPALTFVFGLILIFPYYVASVRVDLTS